MADVSPSLAVVINIAAFFAFVIVGAAHLYIGRSTSPNKKITLPWINLSFGTFLIAINYLIQAAFGPNIAGDSFVALSSYLLIIGGAAMAFTSFVILYVDRSRDFEKLQDRHDELKKIMTRLRKKFLSRELPEEELKKLDTDIVRELAEIEVKLDKLRRRSKKT